MTDSRPTFGEFVVNYYASVPDAIDQGQRRGQYLFNFLLAVRPEIANNMRGTHIDPFYVDKNIAPALNFIASQWEA